MSSCFFPGSMYHTYFGIKEEPFSITPNTRYLYMSPVHREALAHLLFGIGRGGGFVLLTGEVGTGKTTLCRSLLEQAPKEVDTALILNPRQSPVELVASVCDELGVPYPKDTTSLKILVGTLNEHLLKIHAQGRRTVLIIDEAQNLSSETLEQIRLLTNLETETQKLLQIILIGQPELQSLLARPELRQLDQRITARYHLTPLSPEGTSAYIQHRLEVAGLVRPLFTHGALYLVHKLSGGIPRLINNICERALLGAYGEQRATINQTLVRRAAREVVGSSKPRKTSAVLRWMAGGVGVTALAGASWLYLPSLLEGVEANRGSVARVEKTSVAPVDKPFQDKPKLEKPFGEMLADKALQTDLTSAFRTLFSYWGVTYDSLAGNSPCDRAVAVGLRCVQGSGTWSKLRNFNRPAVIELIDDAGKRYQTVVKNLQDSQVTLDFAGTEHALPLLKLAPYWQGDYVFLWEPPKLDSELLQLGDQGPDVVWLRAQLDRAQAITSEGNTQALNPFFDAELRNRVMHFQRKHALIVDGIVGERTLLLLDQAAPTPNSPILWSQGPGTEGQ